MKLVDSLISPSPVWPERRRRVEGKATGLWVLGAGRFPTLHIGSWLEWRTRMIAGALVGVGLLSYLAGLLSFRVKSRWCRECGATTRCPQCKVSATIW